MDLSGMSLGELKALQGAIATEMKSREASEIAKAREQILAIAQSAGLSKNDLLSLGKKKSGAPRASGDKIYQDPDNPANQWRGRGPHPAWVKAALQNGKRLDQLQVTMAA